MNLLKILFNENNKDNYLTEEEIKIKESNDYEDYNFEETDKEEDDYYYEDED